MTEQEVGEHPIALYRLFAANDVLLYVGVTENPRSRFGQHAKEKRWWPLVTRKTITWQESRQQAQRAETEAIRSEKPLHNVRRPRGTQQDYDGHSESRQRTSLVALRLLPAERALLEAAAKRQQLSLSELIRRGALEAAAEKEDQS